MPPEPAAADAATSDAVPDDTSRSNSPARRRIWLRLLLTGLALFGSTTAFVLGWSAVGAVLGVAAGLVSAWAVWGWIQSNGDPRP